MKIYIISEVLMSIAYTTSFVVLLIMIFVTSDTKESVPKTLLILIAVESFRQIISLGLTAYFLLCCNSYLQGLVRDERLRGEGYTVDYQPMREEEYNMNVI